MTLKISNKGEITLASQILKVELKSQPKIIDDTIITKFKKTEQVTNGLSQLKNAKINISNLTVQVPSLDDVFMALTVGKN